MCWYGAIQLAERAGDGDRRDAGRRRRLRPAGRGRAQIHEPARTPPRRGRDPVDFRDERPLLARLTDGDAVAIEAEHSTGDSKPYQTWVNLADAVNSGRRCLFACRPEVAPKVYRTLTEQAATSPR